MFHSNNANSNLFIQLIDCFFMADEAFDKGNEIERKKVSLIYDVDYTLGDGYHPSLILEARGVNVDDFWRKVRKAQEEQVRKGEKINLEIIYLAYLMNEVRHGKLKGLSLREIRQIGERLTNKLYPGLPEFFDEIKRANQECDISHNLVSAGIKPLLEGSVLGRHVDNIFGYSFLDDLTPGEEIDEVMGTASSLEKIPAVVAISRGENTKGYLYPFKWMIYLGDGQTDIPVWRFLKRYGGKRICVYDPKRPGAEEKAKGLEREVDIVLPTDYRVGGPIWKTVNKWISEME